MGVRYVDRRDEEGFEVPNGEVYRLACCDCGLVHDVVFIHEAEGPIGMAARRNNRATAQRRRRLPGVASAVQAAKRARSSR